MIVRTFRCDYAGCPITADASDGQIPPGWAVLQLNEAGVSTVVLHSRDHLVAWTGAVAVPQTITVQQARAVLADWRATRPPKTPKD